MIAGSVVNGITIYDVRLVDDMRAASYQGTPEVLTQHGWQTVVVCQFSSTSSVLGMSKVLCGQLGYSGNL